MITREQDRARILSPKDWPLLQLPLKRKGTGELATFRQPLNVMTVDETEPIMIYLGNMFEDPRGQETKTYTDVDALLDDGWVVD